MDALNAALLVNWLGFSVGALLYLMLAVMVFRHPPDREGRSVTVLLLATAVLGLIWNLGELFVYIFRDFAIGTDFPILTAAAYSALGFLPSVVVHSAENDMGGRRLLTPVAYTLSGVAAILHFYSAISGLAVPSGSALILLMFGAVSLIAGLLVFNFRQSLEKKMVWGSAMLVFVLSGVHFIATPEANSWLVELTAHQSSVPLALVILYQNYRFAFADLFLKRAISVMLLAGVAFSLYVWVAAPLLRYHETHDRNDVFAISLILLLWMATAFAYPWLHKLAVWTVDRVILNRANYDDVLNQLAARTANAGTTAEILSTVSRLLGDVLTAKSVECSEELSADHSISDARVISGSDRAEMRIITTERPYYRIAFSSLQGGRRLLSDEMAMLESVAHMTARRIDALRVNHERCEQETREQEFSKLAAEAQLTALRAQINPHFLFNALTTIGYLIQTTPEKAFQTLIQLTKLLRGVLNSTGEFCTLGDEIKLIENYLDIEKARFEERLEVEIDVHADLRTVRIPALILQPLVENAIKHGISESKKGGRVSISATVFQEDGEKFLKLSVSDTGDGLGIEFGEYRDGVGLRNIADRLRSHYGDEARLELVRTADEETLATVILPVSDLSLRERNETQARVAMI
ncbi:MAG: histidine kinase [Acidobacteria bacterium]|nr:histidine kinase [Acidobacteriota bacterium]